MFLTYRYIALNAQRIFVFFLMVFIEFIDKVVHFLKSFIKALSWKAKTAMFSAVKASPSHQNALTFEFTTRR